MLVLGLVAGLIFLGLSHNNYSRDLAVRAELETMYTLITYLHYYALATAQDQELSFDCVRNAYTYRNITRSLGSGVVFGVVPGTQGPPSNPVRDISSPVTFANSALVCSAQGVLSSGAVYLVDAQKKCGYALSVAVGTGSVLKKYRYGTTWVEVA